MIGHTVENIMTLDLLMNNAYLLKPSTACC